MNISNTKSWYTFFFIEFILDFIVVFLPDLIRPLMGREILDETYRDSSILIFALLGIRLLFLALSFLPSITVNSVTYQSKKKNIQILIILLAIFIFMFITNIGNFLQHFGYSNYVFSQEYKFLIINILTLFTRNVFDFLPRMFRTSTVELTKLLSTIAFVVSAITIVGAITLSLLGVGVLLLNLDKLVF